MRINTFSKAEHLCLRNDIEQLFTTGAKSFVVFPLRMVYREVDHDSGPKVKVLLSVAKRKLHHAVDRNRTKRQLREAYRKNKHALIASLPKGKGLHLGFMWLKEAPADTALIEKKMGLLLKRLEETYVAPSLTSTDE